MRSLGEWSGIAPEKLNIVATYNLLFNASLLVERHTEVSEFLGVTYRHLLYVLADFVKRGILVKTAQGYCIQDSDALREISEGH